MAISGYYLIPPLPEGLEGLAELALDLRWSWSHTTDRLWERIDPELWELTRNPWLILQTTSRTHLEELARDPQLRQEVAEAVEDHRRDVARDTWFSHAHPSSTVSIAYFSMEFGLSEALPIYSGGLGVLAGDHLKTASDLGVPVTGIGLLYQQGYFRQVIDAAGGQVEYYPYNDPSQLPVLPVRDSDGEWLVIDVPFPGRTVRVRAWEAQIGRVKLYLLDTNDPVNSPADQCITAELYGGGPEMRLQQEIILGIGGWRLLEALGHRVDVCHLNEGHAALAVVDRARSFVAQTRQPFAVALAATRVGNVFTTHTPVEAGFDRFPPSLVAQYLGGYVSRELGIGLPDFLALGRRASDDDEEPFNMAYLAVRGAGAVNGVSRLHGEVSRRIFQPLFPRWPRAEVPVGHITNGVHVPSWDSAAADELWHRACGADRWRGAMVSVEADFKGVDDETLWALRNQGSRELVEYARQRLARQLEGAGAPEEEIRRAKDRLDPDVLTIGFARRFATYKRPNLLLSDPDRLLRLLSHHAHPVQLLVAGKAHPRDEEGKELIRAWARLSRRPDVPARVMFLADYDMSLAEHLVQGVDLWINTPRRPWEASGTSGMKILVNGGLNLSELDGWWAEAYRPDVGWALGDGQEHDDDARWDAHEAAQLYSLLEDEVIPCFYDRDHRGIPVRWVARMRQSMAELTPRFSTNRMLRSYVEDLYLAAARAYHERSADGGAGAARLVEWRRALAAAFTGIRFGELEVRESDGNYAFSLPVALGDLAPDDVQVQLFADPEGRGQPEIHPMRAGAERQGPPRGRVYTAVLAARRPASHYTPRVIPRHEGARVPLEARQILWYR